MKNTLVYVILFCSFSCQNFTKETIIGYWKFCDSFGYYEVQIKQDGEITGFNNYMGKIQIYYTIKNDSIEFFYQEEEILSKFKISIQKDELILENDSLQLVYYRLPAKIDLRILYDENDPEFAKNYVEFMKRGDKECK